MRPAGDKNAPKQWTRPVPPPRAGALCATRLGSPSPRSRPTFPKLGEQFIRRGLRRGFALKRTNIPRPANHVSYLALRLRPSPILVHPNSGLEFRLDKRRRVRTSASAGSVRSWSAECCGRKWGSLASDSEVRFWASRNKLSVSSSYSCESTNWKLVPVVPYPRLCFPIYCELVKDKNPWWSLCPLTRLSNTDLCVTWRGKYQHR